MAKRVDTLVVIARNKQGGAICCQETNELLVTGIQALILINYQVLDLWELIQLNSSLLNLVNALVDHLTGEHAAVE